jgi:antirestriction protein ArdC
LQGYAFEELVAEIGNCFLCSDLGLTPNFEQSAAYIDSWLRAMKVDARAIFHAAAQAQKAVDFVRSLTEPKAQDAAA